jgi:hypothetical protein
MKIIETDNFGRDYPDEKFIGLPPMQELVAQEIADLINKHLSGDNASRIWHVVPNNYVLQGGFEP